MESDPSNSPAKYFTNARRGDRGRDPKFVDVQRLKPSRSKRQLRLKDRRPADSAVRRPGQAMRAFLGPRLLTSQK
jgi:hypothetical protein